MSTEEAFQAALDAEPDNHTLREIFADFLDDMNDQRADGMRALGVNQLKSVELTGQMRGKFVFGRSDNDRHEESWVKQYGSCLIHPQWLSMIEGRIYQDVKWWRYFHSRREAEDTAALAFARLPPERRAELLRREPCPA